MCCLGVFGRAGKAARRVLGSILLSPAMAWVACAFIVAPIQGFGAGVTLAWDPSPEQEVSGYYIYYGVQSGVYTNRVSAGSSTTLTIESLSMGAEYFFAATAYTDSGLESDFSAEVSAFLTSPLAGPTISPLADLVVSKTTVLDPIAFTVTDPDTPPEAIQVSATSSNATLLASTNISLISNGAERAITLKKNAGRAGQTTVTVTASDGSMTATQSFKLTVLNLSKPLVIRKVGNGKLVPKISGGASTLTAVAGPGQIFAGWSGSVTSLNPVLRIGGTNNIDVVAKFVANPFLPAVGLYTGLFYEEDAVRHDSSGSFSLTLSAKGAYSGKLLMGTASYPFSGRFNLDGTSETVVPRTGNSPVQARLNLGFGPQADALEGRLSAGMWTAELSADRATFSSGANPAPYAGRYTLVMPPDEMGPDMGYGAATSRITSNGVASVAGTLGDGTAFTRSGRISKRGSWPLYMPVSNGRGSVLGWLSLSQSSEPNIRGLVSWIKPPSTSGTYPTGLTNEAEVVGSAYTPAIGATNTVFGWTSANANFAGGELTAAFSNPISIGQSSAVQNLGTNRMAMKFNPTNGWFTGSVQGPGWSALRPFKGALLQYQDAGFGVLIGTNATSRVELQPPTDG